MAAGYLGGDCVQSQIDATVSSGIDFSRSQISTGDSLSHCFDCGEAIPVARQEAVQGCWYCINCQSSHDSKLNAGYNRRGSKDSQIR